MTGSEFAPEPRAPEYYEEEQSPTQAEYDNLKRIANNLAFYRQGSNLYEKACKELREL